MQTVVHIVHMTHGLRGHFALRGVGRADGIGPCKNGRVANNFFSYRNSPTVLKIFFLIE